jgi:quinol monooxygenase YgiN
MIVVKIELNSLPEKRLELTQTLLSLIDSIKKESGCLNFTVCCNINYENDLIIYEEWKSRRDLERHVKSQRFGVLLGLTILLRNPVEIQIYSVSATEGNETVKRIRGWARTHSHIDGNLS